MKRKIVPAMLICLAIALGVWASPALAQAGCTCHTSVPSAGGAPAAHAPLVVSVTDCTVCHVNWVVPHPGHTRMTATLGGTPSAAGYELTGWVGWHLWPLGSKPHAGVAVYLQQRSAGAAEYVDLAQVTTDDGGGYAFTVASPPAYAAYRAVVVGHVGPWWKVSALFMPADIGLPFTPTLTLELVGLRDGLITRGETVTARGTVVPAELAGNKVLLRLQRHDIAARPHWQTLRVFNRTIGAAGEYSRAFIPKLRGQYRLRGVIPAAEDWVVVRTDWQYFRVRRP